MIMTVLLCAVTVPLCSPPGSGTQYSFLLPPRTQWPEKKHQNVYSEDSNPNLFMACLFPVSAMVSHNKS